jgi:hypothetical protein
MDGITGVLPAFRRGSITRLSASKALSASRASACICGSRTSAPSRSWAWPVSAGRRAGCPWHRPRHGSLCSVRLGSARSLRRLGSFFGCSTGVLMRSHDGAIDHGVFVVSIGGQHLEKLLPHPTLGPATVPRMHLLPIGKPRWQVPPGNARPIAIERASTNSRLSFAVTPTWPSRPGRRSLIRSHRA